MDRKEKALKFININGAGLELGPSYNPILKKSSGANIKIVDHADKQGLLKKYSWMPKDKLESIEEVDYMWSGGTLTDLIGEKGLFDYIIASHFIEHTTDLIGFLQDCEQLLKPDGVLSLIIPDKRFCFDRYKPLSTPGEAIDANLYPLKFHSPGSVLDHLAGSVFLEGDVMMWNKFDEDKAIIKHNDLSSLDKLVSLARQQTGYIDIHKWVFTPSSFSLLIQDLNDLKFIALNEAGSFGTAGGEFHISLSMSCNSRLRKDRLEMLKRIEHELFSVDSFKAGLINKFRKRIKFLNKD